MLGFAGSLFGSMMGSGNLGMMIGAGAGIGAAITFFVVFMIMAVAGAFIGGAILHIFVYIAGGRKGMTQTIKAGMYGSTASLLFGWLPFINIIAAIWSLVTEIIGIRQLHEITTGRAILAHGFTPDNNLHSGYGLLPAFFSHRSPPAVDCVPSHRKR